eukprot:1768095-Amphidinium_carterae.1
MQRGNEEMTRFGLPLTMVFTFRLPPSFVEILPRGAAILERHTMTSGTPGSKRKAIAAIYDDAPTSVTKVRNMKDRSIEQKVRRAIEDHLSGWSDYQKYEMVVGGAIVMRETLDSLWRVYRNER